MVAYLIAEMEIHDSEGYGRYAKESPAVVKKFGGRYLARGGSTDVLEGTAPMPRVVVVEFPSLEIAKAFYHSKEYQAICPTRLAAVDSKLFIVEGVLEPVM